MIPAIRVENLGKRYQVGGGSGPYGTFRERLTELAGRPFRRRQPEGKNADDFWALQDVSFEVHPGEVVGIIGRNGAGKSTLLKILSRITRPTTGSVRLNGRIGSLLEVGTGFHPELTGRENIYLNGAILGMRRAEIARKFDEIVAFAEIDRFLDTPVKRYSSGMYVRLAFAVAAHLQPEILVVDEVLSVGDAAFQKKCLGVMGRVGREGRTILFVSHNMAAVLQLTTRSILLHQGGIASDGPTGQTLEDYGKLTRQDSHGIEQVADKHRPDPGLGRQVEFIELKIPGCRNSLLQADGTIPLHLTVRGRESIDRFRFSLTLFRVDGTPVGSLFSAETNAITAGETATFRLEMRDVYLAPGGYYFGMATGVGNPLEGHTDFDIVLDVLHFEMMAPEGPDGVRARWPAAWGAVRFSEPYVTRVD